MLRRLCHKLLLLTSSIVMESSRGYTYFNMHVFTYLSKTLMEAKITHTHIHAKHAYMQNRHLFQNKLHTCLKSLV